MVSRLGIVRMSSESGCFGGEGGGGGVDDVEGEVDCVRLRGVEENVRDRIGCMLNMEGWKPGWNSESACCAPKMEMG